MRSRRGECPEPCGGLPCPAGLDLPCHGCPAGRSCCSLQNLSGCMAGLGASIFSNVLMVVATVGGNACFFIRYMIKRLLREDSLQPLDVFLSFFVSESSQ